MKWCLWLVAITYTGFLVSLWWIRALVSQDTLSFLCIGAAAFGMGLTVVLSSMARRHTEEGKVL